MVTHNNIQKLITKANIFVKEPKNYYLKAEQASCRKTFSILNYLCNLDATITSLG